MHYCNARIFCEDFQFHLGAFEVKDGRFGKVLPEEVPFLSWYTEVSLARVFGPITPSAVSSYSFWNF